MKDVHQLSSAPRRESTSGQAPNALEATGLSKQYRKAWALRNASFAVPAGRVAALVGPNGSGKTTLLNMVVGLLSPTSGEVRVFGETVRQDAEVLSRVAFLAQDKPLYDSFTVAEMLKFGRVMNPRWDDEMARRRLDELGIPLKRNVSRLSGGQQTQVGLTVAVAKRPHLLVLDEPLADLDPVARHEVTTSLMAAVAETAMTVLLSSHVVPDLVDTCDWLVVLNGGRVQVSGDIDDLLASHRMVVGPADGAETVAGRLPVAARSTSGRQATLLLRGPASLPDPRWTERPVRLEDLVLTYLRDPDASALPAPSLIRAH
ncbi:ABC transporter ATP-binding protein [Actinoplanes sp. DH11]|uniref:ABC transporter ATP-binding protein n=1 Tax=Actinoplanes sp. DH11 TaxID=2857011 RepID=UPI001E5EF98B|nr:ABC transporter ATP-binding protein [Actinoplanes sp. DH11]